MKTEDIYSTIAVDSGGKMQKYGIFFGAFLLFLQILLIAGVFHMYTKLDGFHVALEPQMETIGCSQNRDDETETGIRATTQSQGNFSTGNVTTLSMIKEPTTNWSEYGSCRDVFKNGFKKSGLYTIREKTTSINGGKPKYKEVYCDMTTDGGGWTLVASVHRGEEGGKCGAHNKWSSTHYQDYVHYVGSVVYSHWNEKGSPMWSNRLTMGRVQTATNEDYKGSEYYQENASDVMLSHVPNDIAPSDFESQSFLKYHTTNGFLTKYGSSLKNLYTRHRLERLNIVGLDKPIVSLAKTHINITSVYPKWYEYSYNSDKTTTVFDFDGEQVFEGNQIFFKVNDDPYTQMEYGKSYTGLANSYHVSSTDSVPFLALATISSFDGHPSKFSFKVVSNTSIGEYANYHYPSVSHNGFYVDARALYVYNYQNKPTVVSIFFNVRNDEKWGQYHGSYNFPNSYSTSNLTYEYHVSGPMKNCVVGYMLITRNGSNSYWYYYQDIQNVLRRIVDLFDLTPSDLKSFNNVPEIVPFVKFVKGSLSYPKHNVTSGYLQFRAYDKRGNPYALCPAVRVNNGANPAQFCLGSSNNYYYSSTYTYQQNCGDFSAWETLEEHVTQNRSVDGSRGFVNDLHSTILIFTR